MSNWLSIQLLCFDQSPAVVVMFNSGMTLLLSLLRNMERLHTIRNHFLGCSNFILPRAQSCNGDQRQKHSQTQDTISNIKTILNQVKWTTEMKLISDTKLMIKTPGLTCCQMDKYGIPSFPDVVKFAGDSFDTIFQPLDASGRAFLDIIEMRENNLDFLASLKVEATKSLYDASIRKAPLDVIVELYHVGRTSWTTLVSLYNKDSIFLGEVWFRDVAIDPETRRPKNLHKWWVEKYSQYVDNNSGLSVQKFEGIVPNARPFRARMFWSHTDGNEHVNYRVFYQICLDASYYYAARMSYPTVTESVLNKGIETMECVHLGESLLDDTLEVFSCETGDKCLRFDVCREKQIVFQAKCSYITE